MIDALRRRARHIKTDTYALYLACRHPDVPWYVKLLAAGVVAYAWSPIDLIPDFIPVLGYLDDLLLVPAGILLVIRLIPPDILAECRQTASERLSDNRPVSWAAGTIIIVLWLILASAGIWLTLQFVGGVY